MALLLDGKKLSSQILRELSATIARNKITPKLAIIFAGQDPASEVYVGNKSKRAAEIGLQTEIRRFPHDVSKAELLNCVHELNGRQDVHGIIIQAPLPNISMQMEVFQSISPEKDVDGFTLPNIAKLVVDDPSGFVPCTPLGIQLLLKRYHISVSGKHVVIIGRSSLVGRPLSLLLSQKSMECNATVTLCHSGTQNLQNITRTADIIVVAIGQKHFLTIDKVPEGCVVIDVGINREFTDASHTSYKLYGDSDWESLRDHCYAITPVPGGVGPMTVVSLMSNTVKACLQQNSIIP